MKVKLNWSIILNINFFFYIAMLMPKKLINKKTVKTESCKDLCGIWEFLRSKNGEKLKNMAGSDHLEKAEPI